LTELFKNLSLNEKILINKENVNYIPIVQCRDSYLYFIIARNSNLGIYNEKDKSFTISRFKFKLNYLFEEDHWDTGEPFGTVKPLKEICEVARFKNDEDKLKYLNNKANEKEIIDLIKQYNFK
jgi:hypothetical protein